MIRFFHRMLLFWKTIMIGLLIYILCLIPSSELQKLDVLEIRFTDLIVHLIMFLLFSAVLYHDLRKYGLNSGKLITPLSISLFISFLVGISTEMLQYVLASLNRSANLVDLFFDTAGSVIGILLVRFTVQKRDPGP